MRITFVNGSLVLTGGLRVVFEHARRLRERGHSVCLLAPRRRVPRSLSARAWLGYGYERWWGGVRDGLDAYGLADAVTWFDPERLDQVPDGDAVVATAWRTAEWAERMPARAGRGFYLIQQYEAWDPSEAARVDRTWRSSLRRIVIAHWLERFAQERFGADVWARIPNGVDAGRFVPPIGREPGPVRVGMMYDVAAWKGAADGVDALWRVHRADPSVRFVLFGRSRLRHSLPPGTRYVRGPRQRDLPGLYGAADVFVNSSHSEGFSLVTLEAMACGCALVATAVGEVPEMGRPGEEYLMVPAKDPEALGEAVLTLVRDASRRREVGEAGLRLAQRYTWDAATDQFEAALTREG